MKKFITLFSLFLFTACSFNATDNSIENPIQDKRYPAEQANTSSPILLWNTEFLNLIAVEEKDPLSSSRGLAMLNLAMKKAQNDNIDSEKETAQHAAGAYMLSYFYENKSERFEKMLSEITKGANPEVLKKGEAAAQVIFQSRSGDGSADYAYHPPSGEDSKWVPSPPYFEDAMMPHWKDLKPFSINSPSAFRVKAPPEMTSKEFQKETQEVYEIGGIKSKKRTKKQTQTAHFWADGKGTLTPPGHWAKIIITKLKDSNYSESEKSEIMTNFAIAMADSAIATWDSKYFYDYFRPIDAINAEFDANWQSLIENPNFPEYPSGHSAFSSAAATVLAHYFPEDQTFETTMFGTNNKRKYDRFEAASDESAQSRIFGGIHFASACDEGKVLGENVANYVLNNTQ